MNSTTLTDWQLVSEDNKFKDIKNIKSELEDSKDFKLSCGTVKSELKQEEESLNLKFIKRRKVVMDAVVVPTLKSIFRDPDNKKLIPKNVFKDLEDIEYKMKKFHNPKVKLPKGIALMLIRGIGYDLYPIPLEKWVQDTVVTRQFMSHYYGGNPQETFPKTSKAFLDIHGMDDFMYLNLSYNPHAPQVPGASGLFFTVKWRAQDNGEWTGGVQRLFSRIAPGKWQYHGQYELVPTMALTKEEWASQSQKVRNTWATQVCKKGWGLLPRAQIHLRQTLGREPTAAELDEALDGDEKYDNVTPEQVTQAFIRGEETLGVWTMKCVGYDTEFQLALAEKSSTWAPAPSKPKPTKGKRKSTRRGSKQPAKTPDRKRKRGSSDDETNEHELDEEEASEEEETGMELTYKARGTRSRPIQL